MYRWAECPGSIRLCKDMPNVESAAAAEGTRVHELVARFAGGAMPAQEFSELTPDDQAACKLWMDTIFDDMYRHGYPDPENKCEFFVERPFDLSAVYPGCFGTSDAVLWDPRSKILYVYDYKNGRSVVEVEGNLQLQYYALGALVTLGFPARFVEIVVVQPNARHKKGAVRRWRVDAIELLEFEDFLVERALATESPDAPLVPGRHCYFCSAKNSCPARHDQRLEDASDRFSELPLVDDADDLFSAKDDGSDLF